MGAARPSPTGAFLLAQTSPLPPAIGCRERDTHWPVLRMTSETHVGAAGAHWLARPANHGGDRPVPRLRGGQSDLRWTEQSGSGLPGSAFPSLLLESRQGRGSLRAFELHFAKGGTRGPGRLDSPRCSPLPGVMGFSPEGNPGSQLPLSRRRGVCGFPGRTVAGQWFPPPGRPLGSQGGLGLTFEDSRGRGFLEAPEKVPEPELKLSHKGLGA